MFGLLRGRSAPRSPAVSVHLHSPHRRRHMRCVSHTSLRATLPVLFAFGGWYAGVAAQDPRSALDPITSAVMKHPITTSSAAARDHFLRGQRELDLARFIDANAHFKEAVAADPSFAFAYLNIANTAASLDEFKTNLAQAEQHAAGASDAERLQIQMARKGFDNDLVGQLALGRQLVGKYPDSPRAAILLVKLGHANTFLGDYAAARADYDSAIAVGRANEKAAYAPFRAYVSVYAGDPAAAIDELNRLVAAVDGMGVPDPKTAKVAALTNVAVIATHTRNQAAAERALEQLGPLLMQQADEAGNAAYRRGQQATIAYYAGWWAARRGDYAAAQQQADQIGQLLAPDANPRKLEPMHQPEGFIALYQRKYREAARHLRLGNQPDPYIKYQLALATGGAGDAAEAKRLFSEVAEYNFKTVGFSLVWKGDQQMSGSEPHSLT